MTIKTLYSAMYRDDGYPFDTLTKECVTVTTPDQIPEDKTAALIVWGGADISPSLYGHDESRHTWTGGKRDFMEWALMKRAVEVGIPIIGVCRGAQMACAMAGGFLLQHVENHAGGSHDVETSDNTIFKTNSIHHQMMVATEGVDHELLAWSRAQRSEQYIYKKDEVFTIPAGWKEPEFYYFPKIKGFAIQWHPEAMDVASAATQFVLEKINERT